MKHPTWGKSKAWVRIGQECKVKLFSGEILQGKVCTIDNNCFMIYDEELGYNHVINFNRGDALIWKK